MSTTEQSVGMPGEGSASAGTPAVTETRSAPHARRTSHSSNLLEMVRSLLSVVIIALFILTFIVQPFRIPSESMERTLLVGDFLLVNKIAYAPSGIWKWLMPYRQIRRDDIVVFHYPVNPPEHVVKRVIGLPGDRVHLENGRVWVNGTELDEPYVVFEPAYADDFRDNFPSEMYTDPGVNPKWWIEMSHDIHGGDLVIPRGDYFVMGDNRNFSLDSRYWGFVTQDHIVGRPLLIYFSLREASATDVAQPLNDRLGQKRDLLSRIEDFARWDRFMQVVR
ncbi:MAG TPA: signal peptidase I [Acidobacteriaceae bacterium]|nr:signal peptidase I [Acidobacteriaceae bacterium]